MEDIKLYARTVFIEPLGYDNIEVSLHGVDIADLVSQVGEEKLLGEIDTKTLETYINERKAEEAEDEADD